MTDMSRRGFLRGGLPGLGFLAASGELMLRDGVQATQAVGDASEHHVLIQLSPSAPAPPSPAELKPVTPIVEGPFYRPGAPFRAKLCPPGEPGTTFVLSGRVWALDTRRPLAGAVLDFWHVDNRELYSDGASDFRNRGRMLSSESGAYELEGIRPIPYRPNPKGMPDFWRCAHFHVRVSRTGYRPLTTEIHFKDDPRKSDPMYTPANAIAVDTRTAQGRSWETGVFDFVLERDTAAR